MERVSESSQDKSVSATFQKLFRTVKNDIETTPQLTIQDLMCPVRPKTGDAVSLLFFRVVRLISLRKVLGSKLAGELLYESGRTMASAFDFADKEDLRSKLDEMMIGRTRIVEDTDARVVFEEDECATCSGLPNIGEPVCRFECGFIAGALEKITGRRVEVTETKCWGLGDKVCRMEAQIYDEPPAGVRDLATEEDTSAVLASVVANAVKAVDVNRKLEELTRTLEERVREQTERLIHADKLVTLGTLSAGIAHELKNPLGAVMGFAELAEQLSNQLLEHDLPDEVSEMVEELRSYIDEIYNNSRQMFSIVNNLRKFSVKDANETEPADIRHTVEDALGVVMLRAKGRIKFETNMPEEPVILEAKPRQLVQVWTNLLVNACDAVFERQDREPSFRGKGLIRVSVSEDDEYVVVEVEDNGVGIPEEVRERMFDSFFTTKGRGRGTGLGLSIVKNILQDHGAELKVESEPGEGTRFVVRLPKGTD